jgi:hypothetical protein
MFILIIIVRICAKRGTEAVFGCPHPFLIPHSVHEALISAASYIVFDTKDQATKDLQT